MLPANEGQIELYEPPGVHAGYAIRSSDDLYFLTFDRDFVFVGLAGTVEEAKGLIADHRSQWPAERESDQPAAGVH